MSGARSPSVGYLCQCVGKRKGSKDGTRTENLCKYTDSKHQEMAEGVEPGDVDERVTFSTPINLYNK